MRGEYKSKMRRKKYLHIRQNVLELFKNLRYETIKLLK